MGCPDPMEGSIRGDPNVRARAGQETPRRVLLDGRDGTGISEPTQRPHQENRLIRVLRLAQHAEDGAHGPLDPQLRGRDRRLEPHTPIGIVQETEDQLVGLLGAELGQRPQRLLADPRVRIGQGEGDQLEGSPATGVAENLDRVTGQKPVFVVDHLLDDLPSHRAHLHQRLTADPTRHRIGRLAELVSDGLPHGAPQIATRQVVGRPSVLVRLRRHLSRETLQHQR